MTSERDYVRKYQKYQNPNSGDFCAHSIGVFWLSFGCCTDWNSIYATTYGNLWINWQLYIIFESVRMHIEYKIIRNSLKNEDNS